ncbi:MAG: hypothetical protein ABL888_01660 [Pirellulaceae bacterium]
MAHVSDVDRAAEFYTLLGFSCESRFTGEAGVTNFAGLVARQAEIFLARASEPVVPSAQSVLFYLYSDDIAGLRRHLLTKGLLDGGPPPGEGRPIQLPERNVAFDLRYPFYMPAGELRVHDLDGYCLLVGQLA